MKWPILGILAVFFLQLGFTAYTAIDREIGALVAVNEVTSGSDPIANADQDYDIQEILVSTPNSQKNLRPARTTLVSSKKFVKAPASGPVIFEPIVIALQKQPEIKFKTEHPQAIPVTRESKNYQLSARAVPQAEKRSFVSKSASVLKKPYDWLKALGSRLN